MKIKQKIRDFLKIVLIYSFKQFLKLLWIFPVKKNRIVFSSFTGKQYSDNPKYLFLDLYKEYSDKIEYIWVRNGDEPELKGFKNVSTVKFLSIRFLLSLITCSVYVTNCSVEPFIPKRRKQLYICSWHGGGAYKKLSHFYKQRKSFEIMSITRAKMTDIYTSACGLFTQFLSKDWWTDEKKFLDTGMPRNEILIKEKDNKDLILKLKNKYGITTDKKIILYAPTMRGWAKNPDDFSLSLDVEKLLAALKKRFSEDFVFLFRCHHVMLNRMTVSDDIFDVSAYNDMQELLLISDILITDYSSSMWDFSLMFRPCFLYTPDLSQYEDYQSFYVPISEWPFPYAISNDALEENILNFNESEYKLNVKKHHEQLISFENGTSINSVNTIIEKHMGLL